MNISICAIALDEESYLDEWIDYHHKLGFNHIYLYDNSPDHKLKDLNGTQVQVIHYPGSVKQMAAFNDCLKNAQKKDTSEWIAFLDIDEFIILKKHAHIAHL